MISSSLFGAAQAFACSAAQAVDNQSGSNSVGSDSFGTNTVVEPESLKSWYSAGLNLPVSILLLSLILISTILFLIYFRERGKSTRTIRTMLLFVRLMCIFLVVFAIYDWNRHQALTEKSDLVIAIDVSQSMDITDQYDSERVQELLAQWVESSSSNVPLTRLGIAKSILQSGPQDLIGLLANSYQLKVYQIGKNVQPLFADKILLDQALQNLTPTSPESELGEGLIDIINRQRGKATSAILFMSDGNGTGNRDIKDVASLAKSRSIPFYAIGIGDQKSPRDLKLSNLLCNDACFSEDAVSVKFTLQSSGFKGEKVQVQWRKVGSDQTLASKSFELKSDVESISGSIVFRAPVSGTCEYELFVAPADGEINLDNNSILKTIQVKEETLKVLVVGEYPSREFHFLKQLFSRSIRNERDDSKKTIELKTYLQKGDLRYASTDESALPVFPVREQEVFDFDVIILVDVNVGLGSEGARMSLRELGFLRDFVVKKGKGLVMVAGPHNGIRKFEKTPLELLIPFQIADAIVPAEDEIQEYSFQVAPTDLGNAWSPLAISDDLESNDLFKDLGGFFWNCQINQLKPGARKLVAHQGKTGDDGQTLPIISMQYVGAGKVVFHSSAETYRWRSDGGHEYFDRYWNQLVRYLSKSKLDSSNEVRITTDREEYRAGDTVSVRVNFLDERSAPESDTAIKVILQRADLPRNSSNQREIELERFEMERGVFATEIKDLDVGEYQIWLSEPASSEVAPTVDFAINSSNEELAKIRLNSSAMKLLAERSGGKFYTLENVLNLEEDLPAAREIELRALPPEPIWKKWQFLMPFAFLFTTLLTVEWFFRRLHGML